MICSNCQAEVQDLPFCPYCGHQLDKHADHTEASLPDDKQRKRARRRQFTRRWLFPALMLLVIIAFGILGMALVGFREGTQERTLATQHQAEIHYNRGLIYLEWGQYQLAEAEFEEALRLVPGYIEAQERRQLAQVKQTVTPSPTALPPTSTPLVPTPTPEIVVIPITDVLFQKAQRHYENKEWEQAISKLEQIRLEDINYKYEQITEMLFQSHYHYGMELDAQGLSEAAIIQYDHALDLRPRNPEVSERARRADLYQSALDEWNVNWERATNFLIALYQLAPDYKDTADRLYQACIEHGQELIKQERYCAAAELYEQAIEIRDDNPEITKREEDTRYLCQVTTPAPLQTPTRNGPTSKWSTVHLGTLVGTCYDARTNQYDICAQNTEDNELVTWIAQAEQPALTLDGSMLAYRSSDPELPGLYAMDIISDTVITITTQANAYYPTWAPDNTRVAYTQYDQDQEDWFIYVARIGSEDPPVRIRKGEWPSWGPNGQLALSTCSEENHCGIYSYDPDTGAMRRLTASRQDRAAAWSPSGDEIAYMSDIGLSHNLYVVHAQSGTVRQITKNLFTDVLPVWSPDGQRIAFVTNHNDNWSVYGTHPYPGWGQAEHILSLGAESADWQRFQLTWVAPVVRLPAGP